MLSANMNGRQLVSPDQGNFFMVQIKFKNFNTCSHIWPVNKKKLYSENIHVYILCSFKNNSSGWNKWVIKATGSLTNASMENLHALREEKNFKVL